MQWCGCDNVTSDVRCMQVCVNMWVMHARGMGHVGSVGERIGLHNFDDVNGLWDNNNGDHDSCKGMETHIRHVETD